MIGSRSSAVSNQLAGAPIYQLADVQHRYGDRLVLNIPALEIRAGEVLAVVGPSGAGKSTLLRLLNFLEPPSAGAITFQGQAAADPTRLPLELRRQVTTVFQRPVLLSASVLANVAYGLRLRGQGGARRRAMDALAQLGLAHLAKAPARTLSGGEMQRVALARALVLGPAVLLLDEPTANLDPANVQAIERAVAEAHRQGTTIVLVTHNLFQARRLAGRVALLLEGQLAEVADTAAFFEHPRDPRAAAFVRGEMIY
jgi:tungstate transport system ATP-binding protein